jgi:hypothetical protein
MQCKEGPSGKGSRKPMLRLCVSVCLRPQECYWELYDGEPDADFADSVREFSRKFGW